MEDRATLSGLIFFPPGQLPAPQSCAQTHSCRWRLLIRDYKCPLERVKMVWATNQTLGMLIIQCHPCLGMRLPAPLATDVKSASQIKLNLTNHELLPEQGQVPQRHHAAALPLEDVIPSGSGRSLQQSAAQNVYAEVL